MSGEVRRISLKSVSNTNNNINNTDKNDNKKSKDSKTPKETKSKRFVLTLNTGSDECNEFSFNDLIKAFDEKNTEPNGEMNDPNDDPFLSDEEQNLRKLEKHFQLKYGPKKRKQMEDFIDKGMGYDETDPFIDNEEAYDELVPSTLTTKYGGFYINCGELEFRPLSPENNNEEEEEEEDNIRPVLKRKRKLELISGKRRRSSSELHQKSRKNKIQNAGKTVAQMLQQKKTQKSNSDNSNNGIEEIEINDSNSNGINVSASVNDVVDSVAKGEDRPIVEEKNGSNDSSDAEDFNKRENSLIVVKLPDNLSPDLCSMIDKIKKLAQTSNDGKRNFFNNEVNKLLFDIELKSRPLPQTQRTQIYAHLATHLPCTKQTLISRAKKALMESFDYELNTAISNIKMFVKMTTPTVFRNFQKQMEEAQQRFEHCKQNGIEPERTLPRRLFPFTAELKSSINQSVKTKIKLFEQIGAKSQSICLKDYLYEFLEKEIKPIFPKGWMSLDVLKHRLKWIKQILPQESPNQSLQTGAQPVAQLSLVTKQSAPQTSVQPNKLQSQTQQSSQMEKIVKTTQPLIIDKSNKSDIELIERKLPSNTTIKTVSNTYQMSSKLNDNLNEGLVGKFISTPKEVKDCVNNNNNNSDLNNITSIDLSTKARSSPKPLNTSTSHPSPINLKTCPNTPTIKSDTIKSSSPSPSVSPMVHSVLQSTHKNEKQEKLSRESCLQKLIEQSLGDYPNSSVSSSTGSQRQTKTTSLPQNSIPINEMFAKGFNNTPNKDSKPEICIEIASSPEPYNKAQTSHQTNASKAQIPSHSAQPPFAHSQQHKTSSQSQHKSVNKHSISSISSSTSASNLNFLRNSELPKKKYNSSSSLIQPSNAQKEQELRQNISKLDQMSVQSSMNTTTNRNSNRDTSISITPIPQNKTNDNTINSTKQNSNTTIRHSNSSNVITSTTPTINFEDPMVVNTYLRYFGQMHSNLMPNPMRFMESSALFQTTQNSQNHSLFYPYTTTPTPTTTTTQRSGEGRGRTSN